MEVQLQWSIIATNSKSKNARFLINNTLVFTMKFEYAQLDKETKSNMLKIEADFSLLISRAVQRKHGDLLTLYICVKDMMKHM